MNAADYSVLIGWSAVVLVTLIICMTFFVLTRMEHRHEDDQDQGGRR